MNIRELMNTLNLVSDDTIEVQVNSSHGIVGVVGVLLTATGVDLIANEKTEKSPKAGDRVRIRQGAGGGARVHDPCVGTLGTLVGPDENNEYNANGHYGPLSDFEKVG